LTDQLIPSEKYDIFQTSLVSHYQDPNLESDVIGLINSRNLTKDNYRDFNNYKRDLASIAYDFHEANEGYLGNSFNRSFATIFQDKIQSDIVLSQIARQENKSLEEVKSMGYQDKAKKGGSMMIKEMILAIIETKLIGDQH